MPARKVSEQPPESNPLLLIVLVVAGIWLFNRDAAPTPDPKPPAPVVSDFLQTAYDADRNTQIAVLKELAQQPFDGTTDDGRLKAGEWFNKNRFRNRADNFGAYTDAVAEAIAANAESELAAKLEGAK
jgi:hypothetical protein